VVARKLVEAEIQDSPEDVGAPITIVAVTPIGPSSNSSVNGCPMIISAQKVSSQPP
jgi:hypothetical protein